MPTQTHFQLILDGRQIILSVIGLAALSRVWGSNAAVAAMVFIPVMLYIRNDYQNYLDLGPGGLPPNLVGYIAITAARLWALRDPFTAPEPEVGSKPSRGILPSQALPLRRGPKPRVAGIVPHRQIEQRGSPECFRALHDMMKKLSLRDPGRFTSGISFIERHGMALFARRPINAKFDGEVCHIHDADYSMHMALHPDDSREVLQKGWGQRHPLAWKWGFIRSPVPADFVLVYAPRGKSDQ